MGGGGEVAAGSRGQETPEARAWGGLVPGEGERTQKQLGPAPWLVDRRVGGHSARSPLWHLVWL